MERTGYQSMQTDHNLLVEVQDLQTFFFLYEGVVKAVDGVSFDIRQGRSLGVIGESGCGKSVTAQSIMRIVPAVGREVGGKILFHLEEENGAHEIVNLLELSPSGEKMRSIRAKHVAMIFQEPMTSFSPLHTIGSQIIEAIVIHFPGVTHKEARERTIELLRRVGIPQPSRLVDAYPHQLSGGMRQRAMIAMALSCNPRLLIADEPTTALDVTIEAQILTLLQDLQDEFGMAMMYISHDLAVVEEMSDEIMVMYLGRVMEHAGAEEILVNPLHPYTRGLWKSIPTIDGELERLVPIKGVLPSPFAEQKGCPFFSRCEERMPGVCDATPPPLAEVSPGHWVSCYLYTEPEAQPSLAGAQQALQG
jgi:oligopeptide/dipeptide ABC transporter ATP-binding protein